MVIFDHDPRKSTTIMRQVDVVVDPPLAGGRLRHSWAGTAFRRAGRRPEREGKLRRWLGGGGRREE